MNCNNQNYSTNPDINTFEINSNSPSQYSSLNRITQTNDDLSLMNKNSNNDIHSDTNLNIMTWNFQGLGAKLSDRDLMTYINKFDIVVFLP